MGKRVPKVSYTTASLLSVVSPLWQNHLFNNHVSDRTSWQYRATIVDAAEGGSRGSPLYQRHTECLN